MELLQSDKIPILQSKFIESLLERLNNMNQQDTITIGLSGGTSLIPFYDALREKYSDIPGKIRDKIQFTFLDERLVPLDHEQSNFRLVSEIFLNRLLERNLISRNQILSVRTDISHPEIEYSSQTPRIDIGLFGVGPDGHIASLFPQHSGLHDTSGKYIKISDSPKPPSERISISVTMAKSIPFPYLFFMGTTKNEAYRYFMNLDTPMESCPAKYLFDNERCTVVTNLV